MFRFFRYIWSLFNKDKGKKIPDYIDLINSNYNLNVINTELFNSIKRYELSFNDIRISYNIDLYVRSRTILSMERIGISKSYATGNLKKVYMPDFIDLSNSLDGQLCRATFERFSIDDKYYNPKNGSVNYVSGGINYGSYLIYFYYNSNDPDDIVMEAFSLLERYGFKVEKNFVCGHGRYPNLIVFNKLIYV